MTFDIKQLADPFPAQDLEWLVITTGQGDTSALVAPYIDARAVMNRLDAVCGPENWRDEYRAGPAGGVLCRLSIRVGDEWIAKEDAADNTDVEAVKGGISDALRRAAVKWGIGRYLYSAPKNWVKCQKFGKRVELAETPRLPASFYPAGHAPKQAPAQRPPADPATGEIQDQPPASEPPGKDWRALFDEKAAAAGLTDGDIAKFIKRGLTPSKKFDLIREYCDANGLSPSQLVDAIYSAKVLAMGQAAGAKS